MLNPSRVTHVSASHVSASSLSHCSGLPLPPATADAEDDAEAGSDRGAFALAARRRLHLATGDVRC